MDVELYALLINSIISISKKSCIMRYFSLFMHIHPLSPADRIFWEKFSKICHLKKIQISKLKKEAVP